MKKLFLLKMLADVGIKKFVQLKMLVGASYVSVFQ